MSLLLTPQELVRLRQELQREDLQSFTVVRMALRDVLDGNVDTAIARLTVDADKFRACSTVLVDFVRRAQP